jgi:tetratricopeptide (TPR) repeat protein
MFAGAALVGVAAIAFIVAVSARPERRWGDEGRLDMWRSAVAMTRDAPLLGVGPGRYGRAFREYRDPLLVQEKLASAHNAYLNTAAETGLVGVAVSVWLGVALVRAWWHNRQNATGGRRLRLEAAFAALVGLGIHSLVDVFTITPIVLLIALLAAYCVAQPRVGFAAPPSERHWTAWAALTLTLAYGVWMLTLDAALARHMNSLSGSEDALAETEAAAALDPGLRLYPLRADVLRAQDAATPAEAIAAYERAVALEPTWDTGWLNLAALAERVDNVQAAMAHLRRAWDISARNGAPLHWGRLAERTGSAPEAEILAAYATALRASHPTRALSGFWGETPLRLQAVADYAADPEIPLDWRYRALVTHDPTAAAALVPAAPASAAEWWTAGETTLRTGDTQAAAAAFTEAIRRSPGSGDYYAARARATWETSPEAARRDLDTAALLGTLFEYPNATRALLAPTPEAGEALLATALPPRTQTGEFAAVLYGRPATFDVLPEMRLPGPGRVAMQPWYTLAQRAFEGGDNATAENVYRAILDYAPEETEARAALEALESS